MKTPNLLKTITVAGALAATLTLSACDMHISFGQDDTRQEETRQEEAGADPTEEQVAEESEPGSDAGQDATSNTAGTSSSDSTSTSSGTSNSAGTDTDSSASSSTSTADSDSSTSDSGASDSGSSGEGTGSDGVDLDEQGNGTIPAADLETDIKNAYADKGVYVDLVECRYDLKIISKRGSTSCEVTDNGQTHYGTVKVTSVTSAGVGYQLEFPNIS